MLARDRRETLLAALVNLYVEDGGDEPDGEWDAVACEPPRAAFAGLLSEEEERAVAAITRALTQITAAVARRTTAPPPPPSAITGALCGAELVMRSEIISGNPERVTELLPSFAYLATLPYLQHAKALQLSRRAGELLAQRAEE